MTGTTYPWRRGNSHRLTVDGEHFFPELLEQLQQARERIDIEMYLVTSGQVTAKLIQVLIAAVQRGVQVRCLFDAGGSRDFVKAEREQLRRAGVDLRFYNPLNWRFGSHNFYRDHRKIVLVDCLRVMVGGMGLSDPFCQADASGQTEWHEQMLLVEGPVVADWQDLFDREWERAAQPLTGNSLQLRRKVSVPPHPQGDSGYGRVAYIDSRHGKEVLNGLLAAVRRADSRVWLATPYFLPAWRIRRALQRAARRGVDVRLLLCGQRIDHPQIRYAGQRFYSRLLKAGVRIYEYQPRFLHLKTALVDDWVSLGSCNFDHWTLHWNLEANHQAVDVDLNREVTASFETDFTQSKEWTLAQWRELPWPHRLKIRVWGQINRLVMLWFDIKG
ncbi:phospholipase D-like domain-containing protein [Halopseudomonas pelagia]|uniref:phospholipase D-like domain-containing protein n=1 Tax=Halopseudomonas pelagia TaxID=553151 RepID=UPI00039D7BB6|nr:phosphatidylserine/phosphatidylglycerophosphate/cardiolipin synthase family protein [Halopseudomonas pelagia]|tara:strand:+ start:876 stop:2036 length:1161 start_codon:yes stop_codon:yes gene_type:complete